MKIVTKKDILPIVLIIAAFVVGGLLYSYLPEKVPTHWSAEGEIDRWGSKNFAVFFFPLLILGIYLLMVYIPRIDPLRRNYPKFATAYFYIRTILVIFFVALYFFTLSAALGYQLRINYFIISLLSVLFIVIGFAMPKIEKNYFVGIRTPWTLHSEETWRRTHRFGGKAFIVAGLVSLLALVIPKYPVPFFVLVILGAAASSVVYSYFVFKKIGGFNNKA